MVDKEGNMPNMKEALVSDSVATVVGAVTGTSTVTTFVESASGVEAGGRTGLTAFTTGILFLACIFIAPLAAIISCRSNIISTYLCWYPDAWRS